MTPSDPSICGIFGSSLSKLSLYMVFLDPLQSISCYLPFLPKAFVEFIGRNKTREHTCNAYIVKSNNGSIEKKCHTIKSRCACVWNTWWIYMVANLILLCCLTHISLLKLGNIFCKRIGAIFIHLSFFSGGHLSTQCFKYSGHLCVHFFSFFQTFT